MALEVEAKYRVANPRVLRERLRSAGFRITLPRRLEINWIFNAPAGRLLRLRRSENDWTLTAKGPRAPGALKRREEIEIAIADGAAARRLLELAGLGVRMEYRRFRTIWRRPSQRGELAWDETPFGVYVELEGPAAWIRSAARELGFSNADLEPRSYPEIYCSSAEGP